MRILSMQEYLNKKHIFTHEKVIEEDPRMRVADIAYECAVEPTRENLNRLKGQAIDLYHICKSDPAVWFAAALVHRAEGDPEFYKDLRRMAWCRKGHAHYLTFALSLLTLDEQRNEAATACAKRLIETTLRVIPDDEEAIAYARTANTYHVGWSTEEFDTRLTAAKESARFRR